MNIDTTVLDHLLGKSFSNSFVLRLPDEKILPLSREDAIVSKIIGSRVIHMGCADHIDLIDMKIASGKWLHKLITESASKSIGIDNNVNAIEYIRKLGFYNVKAADILLNDIIEITDNDWDWVVFGELLEHIGNPVDFLSTFRVKHGHRVKRFLISVPSVYTSAQFRNMKKYSEVINSDHRFWFTPYTICRILTEAGYAPEEVSFANLQSLSLTQLTLRKLFKIAGVVKKYPFWFYNTIIVTGNLNQGKK